MVYIDRELSVLTVTSPLDPRKNSDERACTRRNTFNFVGLKEYKVASSQAAREGDVLTVLGW